MLKYLNFNQPSLTNCFTEISTKAVSKSFAIATNMITKTAETVRSIPGYITYSPEGLKYMRYVNSLIPGIVFISSGINFAVYAHKTDSRSKKIAAYLLAAASTAYGIAQIVEYLDISSCIGKEIQSKKTEFEAMLKNEPLPSNIIPNSFNVTYNPNTRLTQYSFQRYPSENTSRSLNRQLRISNTIAQIENSSCI